MDTTIAEEKTGQKAGRREWIGLAVLALPALLVSMDMTVLYLAVPALSTSLKPDSIQLLWITDSYTFMEAGFLITMGALGDRIGRRRLLLAGGVLFALTSTLAAFSPTSLILILARGTMGIAGATLLPSTLSIIRNMFHDDRQRTVAIGTWTTCFSAGSLLGPLIGGFLLSRFWWGAVFLMGVPVMLLLLVLGSRLLPEFREERPAPIDGASTALLITGILAIIYGIKQLSVNSSSLPAIISIPTGALVVLAFIRRQHRTPHPLIDLRLFHNAAFNTALLALFIALFSWSGMLLFIGQYLQLILGLDPLKAGLLTLPGAVTNILACILAPQALRYVRRGWLMAAGLAVFAVGFSLLATIGIDSLSTLVVATMLSSGCGVTVTLGIDRVVASAPPEKAGAAAGISETSTTFGAALGVALLGSIWTAAYRTKMAQQMSTAIPPNLREAARNTLGEALAVGRQIKGSTENALIITAKNAFVTSLHLAAAVGTLLLLGVAIIVAIRLRKLP